MVVENPSVETSTPCNSHTPSDTRGLWTPVLPLAMGYNRYTMRYKQQSITSLLMFEMQGKFKKKNNNNVRKLKRCIYKNRITKSKVGAHFQQGEESITVKPLTWGTREWINLQQTSEKSGLINKPIINTLANLWFKLIVFKQVIRFNACSWLNQS